MANEGEQRELFLTETEKSSALCLANFGDMQGTQTDARNVKELIWNIELRTRKTSGQVTVSYREIGESMFFRAGLGEKATKRAARLAEALGVIRIDCDPRKTGGQGANTFSVNWQAIIRHGHHTTATTRPQEPPQRPQAARRPQEARSPQEATSRPSNHSPQAAPSTSVAESTPVQRPPGHDGGGARSPCPPLYKEEEPFNNNSKNHGHGDDGDQRSGKDGEGWPREISAEQLEAIRSVHKLYGIAAAAGWADSTELGMIQFFALARYCRRKGDNPGAFFTWCLRNRKWDRITDQDEDAARGAVKRIFKRERERETANV